MRRLLEEFPWTTDGLSRLERQVLEALAGGPLPFAELFAAVKGDFYQIDPMLFSPAKVIITNTQTGNSFSTGELNAKLLSQSFGL